MNSTRTTTSTSAATRRDRTTWHSEDHYLDLVVRTGKGVELADVDELLTAVRHGLLTPETGEQAVQTAVSADRRPVQARLRPQRWLAGHGMALTWRRRRGATSDRFDAVTVGVRSIPV